MNYGKVSSTGLHLLLTYRCDMECDRCFVWSSHRQSGSMTLRDIEGILKHRQGLRTVDWIYFEGGEPFLYQPPSRARRESKGNGL